MTSMRIPILALTCAAVVLGAHARAGEESKPDLTCINRREINAISALDDRHAFAKLSASRFYLLTLEKRCRGFKAARTIALERSSTRICGDGASLLSFDYPAVGPMRCRIERIDPVADKSAALDLIDSRAGPR